MNLIQDNSQVQRHFFMRKKRSYNYKLLLTKLKSYSSSVQEITKILQSTLIIEEKAIECSNFLKINDDVDLFSHDCNTMRPSKPNDTNLKLIRHNCKSPLLVKCEDESMQAFTFKRRHCCTTSHPDVNSPKPEFGYFTLYENEKQLARIKLDMKSNEVLNKLHPTRTDDNKYQIDRSQRINIGEQELRQLTCTLRLSKGVKSLFNKLLNKLHTEDNSNSLFLLTNSISPESEVMSKSSRFKYLMFNTEVKEQSINMAFTHGIKYASESMDIPLKSLKRWIITGASRKKGGGRKIKDPQMEQQLIKWYTEYTANAENKVTSKMLKEIALGLSSNKEFTASKGWLEKLKFKYGLRIYKDNDLNKRCRSNSKAN